MVISQAELASMRRVTPTQLAEAAYVARKPRGLPTTRGPAGIDIPNPRSVYRPTVDPTLLTAISRASFAAYSAEQLPATWIKQVTDQLADLLRLQYPPADMAVLTRYGLTSMIDAISVEMGRLGFHRLPVVTEIAVPRGVAHFRTSERGSAAMVPDDLLPFFDRVAEVQATRGEFNSASHWPSQFKARERRWPTWAEIEAAWPPVGAWMSDQRRQAR